MRYFLQVLGMPSTFTSSSLMLVFDSKKYIFNGGEGIQRLCSDYGIRTGKVTDLFLTGLDHDILGSLTGFMLSLKENKGMDRRRIHGPPGTAAYIAAACSSYLYNDHFEVIEYNNYSQTTGLIRVTEQRLFEDENVSVTMLPLFEQGMPFIEVGGGYTLNTPQQSGMAYFVKCKKLLPRFRPDLAKALGVPPGPLFAKLKNRESVVVDGRTITPEEVTEGQIKQPVFAVIHVPKPELLSEEILTVLADYLKDEYDFNALFHLSPLSVLNHPVYSSLLDMLPRETMNLVLHPACTWAAYQHNPISVYPSSERLLTKLHSLAPNFFFSHGLHVETGDRSAEFNAIKGLFHNFVLPDYLLRIMLSPPASRGLDSSEVPRPLDKAQILEEVAALPHLPKLESHKSSYAELVNTRVSGCDPSIMLLGTASMRPGKYRNVSGIWLGEYGGSLLFDCGEGSFAQLYRHFGEATYSRLVELDCLLVSHLHADHHSGTVKVLCERAARTDKPIIIFAPRGFEIYLRVCELVLGQLKYDFRPIDGTRLGVGPITVRTVPVDHRIEAYGFIVEHESGWKVVYSGDTRPCPQLAAEGHGATVLIHEATFDDELAESAVEKYHSTVSEAMSIGVSMDAWKVIMTHFSQRYAKTPSTTELDAVIGFDLLKFKLSECPEAVREMSSIAPLFADNE